MQSNWSSYKRRMVNIQKATFNDEVNTLTSIHYKYLHSLLVKSDGDDDIFNDTFLKLSHCYNPEKDFIQQFKYYFNLLKGAFYRDDKVANYYLSLAADNIAFTEPAVEPDDDIQPKAPTNLNELKFKIQNYANISKSSKRAKKK